MAQQIKFYEKNKIDLQFDGVSITVTDAIATNTGQSFVDYVRNRKNSSGWITTGSTDAANTTLEVDMGDTKAIDTIGIVGHNFKAFTVQYWNVSSWADFSTAISETTNTDDNNYYSFDSVDTSKIKIIITGAQIVNADKFIKQLIITDEIGQFNTWPEIKAPTHNTGKRITKMLSGKKNIVEAAGAFSCKLNVKSLSDADDLALIESLYYNRTGFLMLLSGSDESQFKNNLRGYNNEDIYLMRATDSYKPEFFKNCYQLGTVISMKLEEVIA